MSQRSEAPLIEGGSYVTNRICAVRPPLHGRSALRADAVRGNGPVETTWDLHDSTDDAGVTSMARTTGFPCALVARMVADGRWTRPGVHPPETLGADAGLTDDLLSQLKRRGVAIRRETRRH